MIKYIKIDGGISILESNEFNIKHILECGQLFRYEQTDFGYKIYAKDHKIEVCCQKGITNIFCKDLNFIENYFDLSNDYARIMHELSDESCLKSAINFGNGIRILNSDPLEMIISFIISANNNIPRIKKIISNLCTLYGTKKNDFYAFPTLDQLLLITEEEFKKMGCGYRANYLVNAIKTLNNFDISYLKELSTNDLRVELMKLKGVGRKVADCILLFGFHRTDVFPTDTWIIKVYNEISGSNESKSNAKNISEWFVQKYKDLSGYAQQYLYYERLFRDKEKKNDNSK